MTATIRYRCMVRGCRERPTHHIGLRIWSAGQPHLPADAIDMTIPMPMCEAHANNATLDGLLTIESWAAINLTMMRHRRMIPGKGDVEMEVRDLTGDFQLDNMRTELVNPGIPIPPQASAVHHLIDRDVADKPPLADVLEKFAGADVYVAHNSAFEQSFLDEALGHPKWVCTFKASLRLWPDLPSHANQFLRYHLGHVEPFTIARERLKPHRALSDCVVTAAVLATMMKQAKWGQLITWSREPALYTVLSFGKYKGERYDAAPADYLDWLVNKSEMEAAVKHSARHWLEKRRAAA